MYCLSPFEEDESVSIEIIDRTISLPMVPNLSQRGVCMRMPVARIPALGLGANMVGSRSPVALARTEVLDQLRAARLFTELEDGDKI
jgi:hypothetical protein